MSRLGLDAREAGNISKANSYGAAAASFVFIFFVLGLTISHTALQNMEEWQKALLPVVPLGLPQHMFIKLTSTNKPSP